MVVVSLGDTGGPEASKHLYPISITKAHDIKVSTTL